MRLTQAIIKVAKRIFIKVSVIIALSAVSLYAYNYFVALKMTYRISVVGPIEYNIETRLHYVYMETILRVLADSNDTVVITVDTPGGVYLLGFDLIHAIEFSPAKTISWTPRVAASMGAHIAFATDETHFTPTTKFLWHRPFQVVNGQVVRDIVLPGLNSIFEYADYYAYRTGFKYLTVEQQLRYTNNEDVWVTGADITREAQLNLFRSLGF